MAAFLDKLPLQVQGLKNVNVPPQVKAAHGKVQNYVDQIDKEVGTCPLYYGFCMLTFFFPITSVGTVPHARQNRESAQGQ